MKKTARRRPSVPVPRDGARLPRISIIIEEPLWREHKAALRLIRRAARLALAQTPQHVAILLSGDERLRALNAAFGKADKATNVLSFPATPHGEPYLGDVAIAYGLVTREARAQHKSFAAHAAHLAIHGVLHLLGLDHEKANEARLMEQQEIDLLAQLGIADPYTTSGKAA